MNGFGGLILDCDGVLVDSEAIAIDIERQMLSQWGLDYDSEAYLSRFVGLANRDFHAQLRADADKAGAALPEDFAALMQDAIWDRFEHELTGLPDVESLVRGFPGPVAVASSSETGKLTRKLELTGLADLFGDRVFSTDLVDNGKPAPDLFLHAARAIGAEPTSCLVVEDSINGIRAARTAGMTAFGYTGGGHADSGLARRLEAAGAHAVFASHANIADALSNDETLR